MTARLAALCLAAVCASAAWGSSNVQGTEATFHSPEGTIERCVALRPMPGGRYSDTDRARERQFCGIDFYGSSFALCAKAFSTSPGTLVYDLRGGPYAGNPERFEREHCADRGVHKTGASGDPISFKMSVNGQDTSATFANSALIYYHFARYFDASVHVPVAVLRSIDRREHVRRVADSGVRLSAGVSALRMNHAGWLALQGAAQNPSSYRPAEELFTPDGQLYGVLLHQIGKRYGEEFNGTRRSGWGDGQNRDFQQTAPFPPPAPGRWPMPSTRAVPPRSATRYWPRPWARRQHPRRCSTG